MTFCVWRLCLQYTSVHGDLSDGRFMGYVYVLSSPTFFSPSFLRNPLKGKLMGRSEVFPVLVNLSTGSLLDLVNHSYLFIIPYLDITYRFHSSLLFYFLKIFLVIISCRFAKGGIIYSLRQDVLLLYI